MTCYRWNHTGTCKNCSCVKAGRTCSNSLPRRLGKCTIDVIPIGARLPADLLLTVQCHSPVPALQSSLSGQPATLAHGLHAATPSHPTHLSALPSPLPTGPLPSLPTSHLPSRFHFSICSTSLPARPTGLHNTWPTNIYLQSPLPSFYSSFILFYRLTSTSPHPPIFSTTLHFHPVIH